MGKLNCYATQMQYVAQINGKTTIAELEDDRYTVSFENGMYVARYCGGLISKQRTKSNAVLECIFHQDEQL